MPAIRVVWRKADMMMPPWPGLAEGCCSRCLQPVYIDMTQPAPPVFLTAVLVCVPCGLSDDEMRPEIERVHRAVTAAAAIGEPATGTGTWHW